MHDLTASETKQAKKFLKVVCVIFMMMGVILLLYLWGTFVLEKRTEIFGESVQGVVTYTEVEKYTNHDGNDRERLILHYSFDLPTGETITQSRIVNKKYEHKLSEGKLLNVQYLPSNPKRNSITGMQEVSLIALILGSLLGCLGIFMGYKILKLGNESLDKMISKDEP